MRFNLRPVWGTRLDMEIFSRRRGVFTTLEEVFGLMNRMCITVECGSIAILLPQPLRGELALRAKFFL